MLGRISKPQLIVALSWLMILPWFGGGRQPAALLIDCFAGFLAWFLIWRTPGKAVAMGVSGLPLAAAGFIVWGAVSLAWSVNRFQSARWLVIWLVAATAFGLAAQTRADAKLRRWWLSGYYLIAVVTAAVGFYFYLTGGYGRLTSSFYWANPCAAFLLPAVILQLRDWVRDGGWVKLGSLAVVTSAFWLTDSRGAWLVLGLAAAVAAVRVRLKPVAWSRLFLALAASFVLAAGLSVARVKVFHQAQALPGARFAEAAKGESTSLADRVNYLKSAVMIWRDFPLTGTGAGTYGSVHPRYQIRVVSAAAAAHNLYAQSLAELGVVGAGLLIWLLVELAAGVVRAVKSDRALLWWGVVLAALLIHFGLDIDAEYPALLALAAAWAGLCWMPAKAGDKRPVYPAWMMVAMAVAVGPAISLQRSQLQTQRAADEQQQGDYQMAAEDYLTAHSWVVYDPDILTGEGINRLTLAREGQDAKTNLELANQVAEAAIKQDRFDAQHHFLLARVQAALGDKAAAAREYSEALSLDPYNDPDYYNDPAKLKLEQGDVAGAAALTNKAITEYPQSVVKNRSADQQLLVKLSNLYTTAGLVEVKRSNVHTALDDLAMAKLLNNKNAVAQQLIEQISSQQGLDK